MESRRVEISTGIIFRTILIILALWFLYLVRDVILLVFVAVLIVSAIDPWVDWMQKKRVPRPMAVLIIYIIMFVVIGLSVSFLIPPLIGQFRDFSQNIPTFSHELTNFINNVEKYLGNSSVSFEQPALPQVGENISSITGKIFSGTIGVFSGFISVLAVLAMAFYMAVKEDGIRKFIVSLTPKAHKQYAADLTERIKFKMGRWLQGQIALMAIVFLLDFIGLTLLGVPLPLALAIFAGLMEIIPYVGPIVSAIPGVILGFTVSPLTGFLALLLYWLVQQFENYVITPQVMKKAIGLNPITVIIALLVGIKLGGFFGALLAIPAAAAISVVTEDLLANKEEE